MTPCPDCEAPAHVWRGQVEDDPEPDMPHAECVHCGHVS
jgi:Zn ribbon nucleic-acid-binding protein